MLIKDEFGQEWYDYSNAVEVSPMDKRIMVRQAIESLKNVPRNERGYHSTFIATGDTLLHVAEKADGSIDVYDCKVRAHTWDYKP